VIDMFGWLKREKFVLPPEEYQVKLVKDIEKKLETAKGSERTKLTYMLANQLMVLNQILNKKKPKKPVKMNNKGKWVWVEDE
tara:strand:- start:1060 stop:1305 length:246 start_codon:yes stop_codon:yes gene_type:complete